ncbi:DUF5680 domain-containing protein [Patescibacteria group bacterium]
MTNSVKEKLLEEVEAFYFEAMLAGYAAEGIEKGTITELPGFKTIPYRRGRFSLLDCYGVRLDSPKSAGSTTIWCDDEPIWMMSYCGYFAKEVIPFLKKALLEAYQSHQFEGGRGPRLFEEGSLTYMNKPAFNFFSEFNGFERIIDSKSDKEVGFHKYLGMSLI